MKFSLTYFCLLYATISLGMEQKKAKDTTPVTPTHKRITQLKEDSKNFDKEQIKADIEKFNAYSLQQKNKNSNDDSTK